MYDWLLVVCIGGQTLECINNHKKVHEKGGIRALQSSIVIVLTHSSLQIAFPVQRGSSHVVVRFGVRVSAGNLLSTIAALRWMIQYALD